MTGAEGEKLAAQYLQARGFTILERNWRCKAGEIDLIVQDRGVRAIIEVRLRQSTLWGQPAETVTNTKQKKIIKATAFYQQQQNYWGDLRFDVVAVSVQANGEPTIEYISHAFEATN